MIWSGFMIGILGSLHCVGMCGPIALSLPVAGLKRWSFIKGRLLYNFGRITTYSILGAIAGMLGVGARMFQIQQAFSITLGAILVIWGITEIFRINIPGKWNPVGSLASVVRRGFGKWFAKGDAPSMYMIGVMNGLLPCGLVWLALISASLTATPLSGAGLMALFGLGTFPLMFALSFTGKFATPKFRSWVNRVLPYSVAFFGLLFVLRGMNLGIPYVSPALEAPGSTSEVVGVSCCHKH